MSVSYLLVLLDEYNICDCDKKFFHQIQLDLFKNSLGVDEHLKMKVYSCLVLTKLGILLKKLKDGTILKFILLYHINSVSRFGPFFISEDRLTTLLLNNKRFDELINFKVKNKFYLAIVALETQMQTISWSTKEVVSKLIKQIFNMRFMYV